MDDQQRARELLAAEYEKGMFRAYANEIRSGVGSAFDEEIGAVVAALRAAPEVGRLLALLEQWEQRAAKAYPVDAMLINKHIRELGSVLRGENLLDKHCLAVVANGPQVVPPPALGAHEVHPEAIDAGLDLSKAGERCVAADALEHAASVGAECDGSATAPEGPATHYHCKDGIHGTVRRLRRYSTTAINRNSLQGQTMEEAAAFIEHVLAARPKGVKG